MSRVDASPGEMSLIRTPDQRLRVFVSSTLGELAAERAAAREAIERLRLTAVMFELGARPHPPRALYRAYVEQSHVFIGIYWQSYGWVAPDMEVSGIEDEYALAGGRPCLIYVKDPAPERDPQLKAFLARLKADDRVSYKHFESTQQLAEVVANDLAVLLTERFEAGAQDFGGECGAVRARALPVPPTTLVGRERDLEEVCALIEREDVRLLTLSGAGGIGKTRLALAAAAHMRGRFADDVSFVDLSSLTDAGLVPAAVAAALGLSREGSRPVANSLYERLEGARALLVLDNFEQVTSAAAFVSELLSNCPTLKVMVTSRALLRVRGEHEFPVMPLRTPPADALDVETLSAASAVQLFVQRAQDCSPGFALEQGNAAAVAELCRRLEGIPLAIELAAAHVRVLPPGKLLELIADRLDLLTGPTDLPARQRTLKATIDWSYDLLDQDEQALFAALSVFVGGFTLDAAEAVCSGDGDAHVLEGVSSLVEKSLVAPQDQPNVEPRFRMLETVREYAQERLAQSGNEERTMLRMARYSARFAEQAGAGLVTAEHRTWLSRIDAEGRNIHAVAVWAFEHAEFDVCVEIDWLLGIHSWARGYGEAPEVGLYVPAQRPFFERILKVNPPLQPTNRARLLWAAAGVRVVTGNSEAAIPLLRELMDLQRELGDKDGLAWTQALYGACVPLVAAAEARPLLTEAAEAACAAGDRCAAALALEVLGLVLLRDGEATQADRIQHEALAHAQAIGSDHMVGLALGQLGCVALVQGEIALARSRFAESARLHQRTRDRQGLANALDELASLALAEAKPELAAKAIGAADAIRQKIGVGMWPIWQSLMEPTISAAQDALGSAKYETTRALGAETDADRTIEELLASASAPTPRSNAAGAGGGS